MVGQPYSWVTIYNSDDEEWGELLETVTSDDEKWAVSEIELCLFIAARVDRGSEVVSNTLW